MRNIYDIITEQKIIVDINITSYDMDYTINHLSEQCDLYCVQEGMGEGIKNVANKIIEFIKSIIRKIRELIQKVINFFTGKRDTVKRMDKQIQDANNGIKPSDQGSPEGAAVGVSQVPPPGAEVRISGGIEGPDSGGCDRNEVVFRIKIAKKVWFL
jgi:hypothetical protein